MSEIGLDDYDQDDGYDDYPDPDDWDDDYDDYPDPDDWDDDYDDYPDPDDWDDDYREPDPEDAEIAKSYEKYYEHLEQVHGGAECDCGPSLWAQHRQRLAGWLSGAWYRARYGARQPWTVRLLGAEVTVRLRPRECGACSGRGWFYSKTGIDPLPMPPGYDGVSLCGCGTAIGKLADSRRAVRQMRNEPPF